MDEELFNAWNSWKTSRFKLPPEIIERDIHPLAVLYLKDKEILVLSGLKQTGKSTLAFQLVGHLLKKGVSPDHIFIFHSMTFPCVMISQPPMPRL